MDKSDLDNVKPSWSELEKEFIFPNNNAVIPSQRQSPEEPVAGPSRLHPHPRAPVTAGPVIVIDDSDEEHEYNGDDTQILTLSRSTATIPSLPTPQLPSRPPQKKQKISYGSIVQDEIRQRNKDALGMSGPGRTLGGSRGKEPQRQRTLLDALSTPKLSIPSESRQTDENEEWSCLICTL